MTDTALSLSRFKLNTWFACQRRFQLRYVTRQTWPTAPVSAELTEAFERGAQFHRLVEQHFLGLPVSLPNDVSADVRLWWQNFEAHPPTLPTGKRFTEMGLSVPVGKHFLFGRFDLLVLGEDEAHIYDWKTERDPRSVAQLADDWQTRLYLLLVAAGSGALGRTYAPENIAITYWFARHPQKSVTIRHSAEKQTYDMAFLAAEVKRIERQLALAAAEWPLTDNLKRCETCHYATYCGRDGKAEPLDLEMHHAEAVLPLMEPQF